MKNALVFCAIAAIGLGLYSVYQNGGFSSVEFKEFPCPEGKFVVKFPGEPKRASVSSFGAPNGYEVKMGNGAMAVYWSNGTELVGSDVARLYDQHTATMLEKTRGSQVNSRNVQAGSVPGREVTVRMPNLTEFLRTQVFIVNDRFYLLVMTGPEDVINSVEANVFFRSFQIVG